MAPTPLTDRPTGAACMIREPAGVVRAPDATPGPTLPWAPAASRVPADLGHASGQRAPRAVRADRLAASWTLGPGPSPVSRPRSPAAARPGGLILTRPARRVQDLRPDPTGAAPPLPKVLHRAVVTLARAPFSGSGPGPEAVTAVRAHRRARTARVLDEEARRQRTLTVEPS